MALTTTRAPQTVLSLASGPVPSTSTVSLLPFSLAHDGPAPISTYFHPRPYAGIAGSAAAAAEHRQAAFRGRRVVSSTLALPDGYTGLVYSTSAPLPPSNSSSGGGGGAEDEATRERAAKRAKRAAASAAALDRGGRERPPRRGRQPEDEQEEEEGGQDPDGDASARRRSPRKSTLAASTRSARERAIRTATGKARRNPSSTSSAAGIAHKVGAVVQAKRFSLDSDDEDDDVVGEGVTNADDSGKTDKVAALVTAETVTAALPTEPTAGDTATVTAFDAEASTFPPMPEGVIMTSSDSEELVSVPTSVENADAASTPTAAAAALPPAPPLRTISTASIASSSIITSAPRSPSPPPAPVPASMTATSFAKEETPGAMPASSVRDNQQEEDGPVTLARDEKRLVPNLTFDRIEVWNPDWPLAGGKVTEDDDVGRAVVEWIGLAAKVRTRAAVAVSDRGQVVAHAFVLRFARADTRLLRGSTTTREQRSLARKDTGPFSFLQAATSSRAEGVVSRSDQSGVGSRKQTARFLVFCKRDSVARPNRYTSSLYQTRESQGMEKDTGKWYKHMS